MPNDRFLVDTSAWLFALRRDFVPEIKNRIDGLLKDDRVVTTGIVQVELLSGTRTEEEYRRLKSRLEALESIRTDDVVWKETCENAYKLRRRGLTVPSTDVLIATCSLMTDSTVLHSDAHFDLMAKPLGLKVESLVKTLRKALR